uniref:Glutamate receptor n=1 Tax=Timema monikensis TaxID=170555 RepID=A0A7R9EDN9_9NEOP|nr:unnamed protein product [Timema monikensis]
MALGKVTLFLTLVGAVLAQHDRVNIGGLFHDAERMEELAFRYAAEVVNSDESFMVSSDENVLMNYKLVPLPEQVVDNNSFLVANKVCTLLFTGVAGIFGPTSGETAETVQSICDTMDVPHIETRWDIRQRRHALSVNLYPHPATLSKVFVEMVKKWGWTSFTIIYEDADGLIRLNELLKMYEPKTNTITIRQLDPESTDHRETLRIIKKSGEENFVLDCSIDHLYEILTQAQQVGLMSDEHSYIITSLDFHTLDLETFQHGGSNITGVRLISPEDELVTSTVSQWVEWIHGLDEEGEVEVEVEVEPETLRVSTALMYDAVFLFAKALQQAEGLGLIVEPLDCESDKNWIHGTNLINFMKDGQNSFKGLTGMIQFDNEGFRSNLLLDIVELSLSGLQKVGTWNSTEGLNLTRIPELKAPFVGDDTLANKTLVVLTAISEPYGFKKLSNTALKGNDRYEGFGIDLIHEISLMLNFNYTFEIQWDNAYGSYNNTTMQWSGMLRKIMDGEADLAITDLSITSEREGVVDFTMPFMNLGISILYKKPEPETGDLFSFMKPFSRVVWAYMFSVYVGVSVLLYLMGRFSPYEWTNPYPCIENPEELENQFSLKNSLWFTIGSLMQQGSEIAPIAVSTRMVAGIWWFFTLIMVSSYTANLAAFLTVENIIPPFEDVKGLANQNEIKYGAKGAGATYSFFRAILVHTCASPMTPIQSADSTDPLYQKMFQYMTKNEKQVFVTNNTAGRDKVLKEKYAYIMESTSIEYFTERYCDLKQVNGLLDNKGYGIAMKKNSPYRNLMTTAVLKLQESGKITELKDKWWKQERGGGACKRTCSSICLEEEWKTIQEKLPLLQLTQIQPRSPNHRQSGLLIE